MGRLGDKVAIVTGAGTGLGRSTAVLFAKEGAKVVGCGRTEATGAETLAAIADAGGEAAWVSGDVSKPEDVDRIVRETAERYGRVDALVNNAALLMSPRETQAGLMGTALEIKPEDWDVVMEVNLRGVFLMCQRVLPLMKEQAGGAIVNIASTAAVQGYPNSHHYSATKGGVTALTKSLAVSYGPFNVRVNSLIAGGFASPGVEDLMPLFAPLFADPQLRYLWCPLGRLATSDEIAPTIAFLCSDDASYVHGADIAVDGGQSVNAVPNFGPRPTGAALYVEDLLAAGTAETGLDDYGDRDFVEGLEILADSARNEARLSRFGHMMVSGDFSRMLANRLRFERDRKAHPEMLDERIEAPIVVAGLPRTGTSKLQRMMAADPGVQRLDVWRLLNPAPFPGENGMPQGRIDAGLVVERTLSQLFPEVQAAHPTEALEPDEELLLMELTFRSVVSSFRLRAPSFRAFVDTADPAPAYAYMRDMLRYLQWQDGGGRGRPWIMKSPVHLGNLSALFATFPDATLVHLHRDPVTVVVSFCRLMEVSREMSSQAVDPKEIGADMVEFWPREMAKNLAQRRELGEDRIIDIPFERVRDDAIGVIADVYAKAGRELTPEADAAMRDYEQRRPEGHFGAHSYDAEHFGLTEHEIRERFGEYLERFETVLR